ncbi:MAG: CHAT domain-containing protein [Deltaproteobacteria bacterium]|nr:CHAT domain-containing protein [Deltaproteobacteria bacterium]
MISGITRSPIMVSGRQIFATILILFCVCYPFVCRGQGLTVNPDEWPVSEANAAGANEALKQFSNSSGRLLRVSEEPKRKYQWLFKESQPQQSETVTDNVRLLEKFDMEVREARRLYLAGEIENAVLKYRNAIDQFEFILDDAPPVHPLLKDLEQRFSVFEEIATKILGPISSDIREEDSSRIFHLMEKRRLARRNLALKRAGLIEPFDVPASLLKQESEILNQLLELKGEPANEPSRSNEDTLRNQLIELRQRVQKPAPLWTLLRKGLPVTLGEIQTETLKPHELILDFNLLSDRIVVGLISNEKAIYTQAPIHKSELDRAILNLQEKLREYSTGNQSTFMGHAWKEPCRRVYRHLVGKLPPLPKEKTTVLVIPDRSLWYIPFPVILDAEDRPFGQDRLITMIPSADILKGMRTKDDHKSKWITKNDLLVFESIPWVTEESLRETSSPEKPHKKTSSKLTESEKIEKLVLSNGVYPKPSDVVIAVQKLFRNFEVFIGPTATIDRFLEVQPRAENVAILAVPLGVQDEVAGDVQPCFFFSPDKSGQRRFLIRDLFTIPISTRLTVLPISWFEVRDQENAIGDGPLLMNLALLYSGSRLTLINYSDPNWGSEEPFLSTILKKVAAKESPVHALADVPRELTAGLDSSFSGKPPSWSGWILLGDPER